MSGGGASAAELNWVQCDVCSKWRRLPPAVDPSSLPDTWKCADTWWDDAAASCDAPEEEWQNTAQATAGSQQDYDERPKRKRGRPPKTKRSNSGSKSQGSGADGLSCQACEGVNEVECFVSCAGCGAAWHCYCVTPPLARPSPDFLCEPCQKTQAASAQAQAAKRRRGRPPGSEREAQRYFAIKMPYSHEQKARLALTFLTGHVEAEAAGELGELRPRDLLLLVWGLQPAGEPAAAAGPLHRVRVALIGSVAAAEADPDPDEGPPWPGSRPPQRRVLLTNRRVLHNATLPALPPALLAAVASARAVAECGIAPFFALLEPEEAAPAAAEQRALPELPVTKRLLITGRGDPPKAGNAVVVEVLLPGSAPRRRCVAPGFEPAVPELGPSSDAILRNMREGEQCELRDERDPSRPAVRVRAVLSCGPPFPPSPECVRDRAPDGGSPPLFVVPPEGPPTPEEREARRKLVESAWSETLCRVLERLYRGCAVQLEAEIARPFAAGLGLARTVDALGRVTLEPVPFETVRELREAQYEARELPLRRSQLDRLVKAAVEPRGLNRIARRLVEEMARFLFRYSGADAGAAPAVKEEDAKSGPPAPPEVRFAFEIEAGFFLVAGEDPKRRARNRTETERILRRLGFDVPNGEVSDADPSSFALAVSARRVPPPPPRSEAAQQPADGPARLPRRRVLGHDRVPGARRPGAGGAAAPAGRRDVGPDGVPPRGPRRARRPRGAPRRPLRLVAADAGVGRAAAGRGLARPRPLRHLPAPAGGAMMQAGPDPGRHGTARRPC